MSNIVPQPQITFENNKIYVDSPVDVKYTLDGLDPVFYGVIYTSPISISHTTTIKAISVNSLGEFSNLVAGTFTPESDVSDGASNSVWIQPATYTYAYIMNPWSSGGGSVDLSSYVTYDYLDSQSYVTSTALENAGYITAADIPEVDLSSYVTYSFLSSQSYITSIPSEYITQDELTSNSYLTQHQDLTSYLLSPTVSGYTGQMKLYNEEFFEVTSSGNLRAKTFTYNQLNDWNAYTLINRDSLKNFVNGRLADIESTYATTSQIPVIDENLIPNTTGTYTLGDSSYMYSAAYVSTLKLNSGGNHSIGVSGNAIRLAYNDVGFYLDNGGFRPGTNGDKLLGTSSNYWGSTYTSNIYCDKLSYTSDKSKLIINDRNVDIYANNKKLLNISDYSGVIPIQSNVNLGGSSNKWGSTYTYNLYADNIVLSYSYNSIVNVSNTRINFKINQNNRFKMTNVEFAPVSNNGVNLGTSSEKFNKTYTSTLYADNAYISNYNNLIWTGTSEEYALLDNYTTYQIYMIKEA